MSMYTVDELKAMPLDQVIEVVESYQSQIKSGQEKFDVLTQKVLDLQAELGNRTHVMENVERERLKAVQQRDDAFEQNGKLIDLLSKIW